MVDYAVLLVAIALIGVFITVNGGGNDVDGSAKAKGSKVIQWLKEPAMIIGRGVNT
jgi:hypothetical protein